MRNGKAVDEVVKLVFMVGKVGGARQFRHSPETVVGSLGHALSLSLSRAHQPTREQSQFMNLRLVTWSLCCVLY